MNSGTAFPERSILKESIINKCVAGLVESLYPRRCPACDGLTDKMGELICDKCRNAFSAVRSPFCFMCGKEIGEETEEYCRDCRRNPKPFVRNYAVFNYDETARTSVMRFKNGGRREYARYYAGELLKRYGGEINKDNFDIIIPVPVTPAKKRDRGYNQAAVLAKEIGRAAGIPVREDILMKTGETASQKELGRESRLRNLRGVFRSTMKLNRGIRILLVDDVYTTGSTLSACALALMHAGASRPRSATVFVGMRE